MLTQEQFVVPTLGPNSVTSPLLLSKERGNGVGCFVKPSARVRLPFEIDLENPAPEDVLLEQAGPRAEIYFKPSETRAAVVTCGGLCPGMNNVIRSLFQQLHHQYGIKELIGIRHGYSGFRPDTPTPPMLLTPEFVEKIHQHGGTVLGSSRGPIAPEIVVDYLERENIQILFCIGGDGTQRGAHNIAQEALRRGSKISVVGIPKTIDNDINFVWQSFGYQSAIERAKDVIDSAHVESKGAPNGISIVKLMGREAGFIAAGATLASQEVNFTLIPEVQFALDGENGFLEALYRRMLARGHAVIVVAEGAGQELVPGEETARDASGNLLQQDIGYFLKLRINAFFAERKCTANVRYFDPSYYIRSVPANTLDALLCDQMARSAAHAAMAGKTDILIGYWYGLHVHVPLPTVTAGKRRMSADGDLWRSVLACTGQPPRFF